MRKLAARRVISFFTIILNIIYILIGTLIIFMKEEFISKFSLLFLVIAMMILMFILFMNICAYYRFFKIPDDNVILIDGILMTITNFFMIFGIQTIMSLTDDYKAFLSYSLFLIAFGFNFVLMFYNIFILFNELRVLRINAFKKGSGKIPRGKHKNQLKPHIIIIGILVLSILAAVGLVKSPDILGLQDFDVVSGITIEFAGINGYGFVEKIDQNVEYDKKDPDMEAFVKTIKLNYKDTNSLSNGDEFRVTVNYDHDQAKALKLNIKKSYQTFTVTGLGESYGTNNKVSDKLLNQLVIDSTERLDYYDYKQKNYKITLDSVWLVKDKKTKESIAAVIHKVNRKPNETNPEKMKFFYRMNFYREFSTDYTKTENKYWISKVLKTASKENPTSSEEAEKAMKLFFNNHTFERLE